MLDGAAKKLIQGPLDRAGLWLGARGVRANHVTLISCVVGLVAAGLIATGHMLAALLLIVLSRIGDGLDGSIARASRKTDFGGYLAHGNRRIPVAGKQLQRCLQNALSSFAAYRACCSGHETPS